MWMLRATSVLIALGLFTALPGCAGLAGISDSNSDLGPSNLIDMGAPPILPSVTLDSRLCPIGQGGSAVATGPIDGDARPDVVFANTLDNSLTVYINAGSDGACPTAATFPTGKSPSALAVGDLSGDGFGDVVVASGGDNTVSVHINKQDGTLLPPDAYPVSAATAVVLGDIDGKQGLDVVALSSAEDAARLLKNGGSGLLTLDPMKYTAGRLLFGATLAPIKTSALDLILLSAGDDRVDILAGDGTGALGQPVAVPTPGVVTPVSVLAADLDKNNLQDLVVLSYGDDNVVVLLNQGGLQFATQRIAVGRHPAAAAVLDLTRDGLPDLAVVNADDDSVQILVNLGSGLFATDEAHLYKTAPFPAAVAAVDLSGDGLLDLVIAHRTGGLATILYLR